MSVAVWWTGKVANFEIKCLTSRHSVKQNNDILSPARRCGLSFRWLLHIVGVLACHRSFTTSARKVNFGEVAQSLWALASTISRVSSCETRSLSSDGRLDTPESVRPRQSQPILALETQITTTRRAGKARLCSAVRYARWY
jgi:hypothetical protein